MSVLPQGKFAHRITKGLEMLPIMICRHYNVNWLDSYTCKCSDCGKHGQWTKQGFAIWVRAEPKEDSPNHASKYTVRVGALRHAKVA